MPHEIDRILALAASRVWLIDEVKADEIVNLLALRAASPAGAPWSAEDSAPVYAADPVRGRSGPVHVLQLQGTIIPRSGMMSRMSGGASLDQFGKAFEDAASDPSAQAIVIGIDSPGGVVDMVAETAEKVYAARRPGRPIIAVANTMAASAAYWLASAADEIVVTPSGSVGSIGVYGMHEDLTEALKMRGVSRTLIRSGPRKAEGAVGPLDDAAMKHRQAGADYAYDMFVKAVARNRNLPEKTVRADPETSEAHLGGGRSYHARDAVRLGLADRVATFEDTLMRAANGQRSRRASMARARLALT